MLLDSLLDMLLGAANILFAGDLAVGLVHHYQVAALPVVLTVSTSAVAFEIGKVKGDNIAHDFAVEVPLKELPKVEEAVVGHQNAEPGEGGESLLHVFDGLADWNSPIVREPYFEVGGPLPVSWYFFVNT